MRRIVTHVLSLHLGPFIMGFSVVTFMLTTDFLLDYLDLLINKGVGALVVLRLFLYALGWMTALSVPCGVLVAVLMAFGRMAQDNEITALRASGVNPARVLVGPLVASAFLALGLAWFDTSVLPETNHAYANLMMDIGRKRPAVEIREGVLLTDIEGYALLVRHVERLDAGAQLTASDGVSRRIGAGEVILVEDTTGKGHLSKALDGKLRHCIFVTLD